MLRRSNGVDSTAPVGNTKGRPRVLPERMDRISALRNLEEALTEFEAGHTDLAGLEERALTVLRTYATEFEGGDDGLSVFRAYGGDGPADGVVVVAADRPEARDRIEELVDEAELEFELEHLG